jgi:cell division protein FtsB
MIPEEKSSSNKRKRRDQVADTGTQEAPNEAASPWVRYLTGKKISPLAFLRKMESAVVKTGITVPDDAVRAQFSDVLLTKPDKIARLLDLFQACGAFGDSLHRIILDFAKVTIERFGIAAITESLDKEDFKDAVSSWLDTFRKKPLKKNELLQLLLLLQFGWQRGVVDHDTSVALIGQSLTKPAKGRGKKKPAQKPLQSSLAALLGASPTPAVLSALLVYAKAASVEKAGLSAKIRAQAADVTRLSDENETLDAEIGKLKSEINQLRSQIATTESRAAKLEQQIVDLRDGYRHKMDDLRGKIRGMLQGQLTRLLQTALDASLTDPPWTVAIQERLEDALQLIEREAECLQPSE